MIAIHIADVPSLTSAVPWLGSFLGAVVIVGLLSMVTIQLAKDFFSLRFRFQRAWIRQWIEERFRASSFVQINPEIVSSPSRSIYYDLLSLAGAPDGGGYLLSLPIEQLCGQINAAIQAALENPESHQPLIATFASTANITDLSIFFGPRPSLVINEKQSEFQRQEIERYAEARNRVAHQAERAVDNLQISIGSKWKLSLQGASIVLSLFFAGVGIGHYWTNASPAAKIRDGIAIGLIAGYLAPVARDIVAKIQHRDR
jgi:hypothetical protein